jgi:hydrogenase small subunit
MHLKKDKKLKLIWLHGVSCNANSHSFLNLDNLEYLLSKLEIIYHPILPSVYTLSEVVTMPTEIVCDIVVFEGSYDPLFQRASKPLSDFLPYYFQMAKHIVALGSCASFGGIFKEVAPQRSSGLLFNEKKKVAHFIQFEKKIINLSGCPVHPEWLEYVLEMFIAKQSISLDQEHRPVELYSTLAHHGCTRNEYFEWKVDSTSFGTKEGCLFYQQGCRAPMTHSSCNKILWGGVSSKTRVGTPCFGCTEADFPRKDLFHTKTNMSIPEDIPVGISKRSYLTLAGIAKTFHIKRLEKKLIVYEKEVDSES